METKGPLILFILHHYLSDTLLLMMMMANLCLCIFETGSYACQVGLEPLLCYRDGLKFLILPPVPSKGLDYRCGSLCPVYAVWGSHPGFPAGQAGTVLTEPCPQPSTLDLTGESPDAVLLLSPILQKRKP